MGWSASDEGETTAAAEPGDDKVVVPSVRGPKTNGDPERRAVAVL